MIALDMAGIGARVQKYRKLNGLSAEALAQKAGGGVTRGMIAKMETGNRLDIGLGVILSIAWALGVPPVALILPIDKPWLDATVEEKPSQVSSTWTVVNWFCAWPNALTMPSSLTPAGSEAVELLLAIEHAQRLRRQLDLQREEYQGLYMRGLIGMAEGAYQGRAIDALERLVEESERELRERGVKLNRPVNAVLPDPAAD